MMNRPCRINTTLSAVRFESGFSHTTDNLASDRALRPACKHMGVNNLSEVVYPTAAWPAVEFLTS